MNPILTEIKQTASGAELLADWLGDAAKPVHEMVAEMRSQHCIAGDNGNPCPLNVEPNWWGRVKHVIADWILGELELKHQMNLKVSCEEQLHMCKACGCCLRLAVWVPKATYARHKLSIPLEKLPAFCWKRKEMHKSEL